MSIYCTNPLLCKDTQCNIYNFVYKKLHSRLSNKSLLYKIKVKLIFWPYMHRTCTFPFLSCNTLYKHDVWTNVEVNGWTFILLIWSSLMNRHHYHIYLLLVKWRRTRIHYHFRLKKRSRRGLLVPSQGHGGKQQMQFTGPGIIGVPGLQRFWPWNEKKKLLIKKNSDETVCRVYKMMALRSALTLKVSHAR